MNIRKGTLDDLTSILNLQLQLEDFEAQFDSNLKKHCYSTSKGKDKLIKRITNLFTILYVALNDDNKIIGFIDGSVLEDAWWYEETVASLDHICVDKEYRNKGIGNKLIDTFEQDVKNKGARYIRLLAFNSNNQAISLYKKKGFIEYSTFYNKEIK